MKNEKTKVEVSWSAWIHNSDDTHRYPLIKAGLVYLNPKQALSLGKKLIRLGNKLKPVNGKHGYRVKTRVY